MKWIRLFTVIFLVMAVIYLISMFYVEENRNFQVVKEVDFPKAKVFEQFNNTQKFASWYQFSDGNQELHFQYFSPYEGEGSSLHFENKNNSEVGDFFIRKIIPNQQIKYQFLRDKDKHPFLISVKFDSTAPNKTQLIWHVQTPSRTFLKRSLNILSEKHFTNSLDKSMEVLNTLLSKKVDKETKLLAIKYDTIITENRPAEMLLGLSATAPNRAKEDFANSVWRSYNSLQVFLTQDMDKKDDEFGEPQLIMRASAANAKEISYFLGVKINNKEDLKDNSFVFQDIKQGKYLTAYYKGDYNNRKTVINQLKREARRQKMAEGRLTEIFMQPPNDEEEVILKIMLEIYELEDE